MWHENYTPLDKQLGGKYVNDERVLAINILEKELAPWFDSLCITIEGTGYDDPIFGYMAKGTTSKSITIPYCQRETLRRFEFAYAEMSVWIRK